MHDMYIYDMIFSLKLFDSFSGKPIQFAYKNWVLTSDDGYVYYISVKHTFEACIICIYMI